MFLRSLHLPLISAGYFGGVIAGMLEFLSLRIHRSDQGMTPSLSPGLRAQTVALHRRLSLLTGEFHRLARLAREGRLRVYPDRASPAGSSEATGTRAPAARRAHPEPASAFGPPASMAHGATLAALPTRGFGWMLGFVPAAYRDALPGVLRNPEMIALIGASPTAARLLRSLCHGLGVQRLAGVFPTPRRRRPCATPRIQRGGGTRSDGDTGGLRDETAPGSATGQREPAIVMSAQARARWWAERRGAGFSAGDPTGAAHTIDPPLRGRLANQ